MALRSHAILASITLEYVVIDYVHLGECFGKIHIRIEFTFFSGIEGIIIPEDLGCSFAAISFHDVADQHCCQLKLKR